MLSKGYNTRFQTYGTSASRVLGPNDGKPSFGPLVLTEKVQDVRDHTNGKLYRSFGPLVLTEMDSIRQTLVFLLVLFSFNSIISVIKIFMITMSNDHHHHCDCCTTQCRQQGLESLVKLTTTSGRLFFEYWKAVL